MLGGRACFCQVNGCLVGSVYAAHHDDRDIFLREVLDFVAANARGQQWLVAWDFNLVPAENWLLEVLVSEGACCARVPGATSSRWDGERLIDYGISSAQGVRASFDGTRYSDHKALKLEVPWNDTARVRLLEWQRGPKLIPTDFEGFPRWRALVAQVWEEGSANREACRQACRQLVQGGAQDVRARGTICGVNFLYGLSKF